MDESGKAPKLTNLKNYKESVFLDGNYNYNIEEINGQINKLRSTEFFSSSPTPVNLKVNINNNFYNSNIKIIEKNTNEEGIIEKMITLFFGKGGNNEYNQSNSNLEILNNSNKQRKSDNYDAVLKSRNKKKTRHSAYILNPRINVVYLPCTNCGNLIYLEELDNHSDICFYVKEEVMKNENNIPTFKSIDYKITKLIENLNSMKNNDDRSNDLESIILLNEYLSKACNLNYLNHATLVSFKNLITNLDYLILSHKGTISNLIIVERSKTLVIEKFNIIKDDMRKKKETEISNKKKTGTLCKNVREEELIEESKNDEVEKNKIITDNEGDDSIIKCRGLKKKINKNNSLSKEIYVENDLEKIDDEFIFSDESFSLDINKFNNLNEDRINIYRIDDIKSDFEICTPKKNETSGFNTFSSRTSNGPSYYLSSNDTDREEKLFSSSKFNKNTLNYEIDASKANSSIEGSKNNFREFAKIYLKVKFEKMNNTHRGQAISDKLLWKQIKQQGIPYEKWTEFVLTELNNCSNFEKNQNVISSKSSK